jgi:hypothetical protein
LPLAAAIIGRRDDRTLVLNAYNAEFQKAVRQSSVAEFERLGETCLSSGLLADHLHSWFDGADADALDFRDGQGFETRFYRLRLGALPEPEDGSQRCLLTVTDRTVEVQAERNLRAEMLRDSPIGSRSPR